MKVFKSLTQLCNDFILYGFKQRQRILGILLCILGMWSTFPYSCNNVYTMAYTAFAVAIGFYIGDFIPKI